MARVVLFLVSCLLAQALCVPAGNRRPGSWQRPVRADSGHGDGDVVSIKLFYIVLIIVVLFNIVALWFIVPSSLLCTVTSCVNTADTNENLSQKLTLSKNSFSSSKILLLKTLPATAIFVATHSEYTSNKTN